MIKTKQFSFDPMSCFTRVQFPSGFPQTKSSTLTETKKIIDYKYRNISYNTHKNIPNVLIELIDFYRKPYICFESHRSSMETIFKVLQNRVKIHALFRKGSQSKVQTIISKNQIKIDSKMKIRLKSCYWSFAQIKLSVGFCTTYNFHYQRGQVWKLMFNDNLNKATKYCCSQILYSPMNHLANKFIEYWDPVQFSQDDIIEWEKNGKYMLWYKNKQLLGAVEHYLIHQPLYYIISIQLYSKDINLFVEDEEFLTYENVKL